jgi:hypothetical protein
MAFGYADCAPSIPYDDVPGTVCACPDGDDGRVIDGPDIVDPPDPDSDEPRLWQEARSVHDELSPVPVLLFALEDPDFSITAPEPLPVEPAGKEPESPTASDFDGPDRGLQGMVSGLFESPRPEIMHERDGREGDMPEAPDAPEHDLPDPVGEDPPIELPVPTLPL